MRKLASFAAITTAWIGLAVAQNAATQPPSPTAMPTAAGRYDAEIQRSVTDELRKHDAYKDVRASVEDGIVTLQGSVPLYRDKEALYRHIHNKHHVQGVRNLVTVAGKTVPDAQLRDTLAQKLRYDRINQGITFNNFGLNVQNGVVTITGQARTPSDADSALSIVENTPGVKDVIDNIEVLPTSLRDDEIRLRVARAIYGYPALQKYALDPQAPIRIVVDHGNVTLYGVVDSAADRTMAELQARSVPDVFNVNDKLVVAGQASPTR